MQTTKAPDQKYSYDGAHIIVHEKMLTEFQTDESLIRQTRSVLVAEIYRSES